MSNLECQVAKLQTDLSTQYILYRNEADAKKIVISDLNQLKKSQQVLTCFVDSSCSSVPV